MHGAGPLARRSPDDEARLLRAIHALDAVGTERGPPAWSTVAGVLDAWGFFLDATVALECAGSEDARQEIALVLEARVLSCIARFLMGRPRRRHRRDLIDDLDETNGGANQPRWGEWPCPQGGPCIAHAVRSAACCFLFQLSRRPSTAMLVMRSGLYRFLFDECHAVLTPIEPSASDERPIRPSSSSCDAQDATVAVDPFDWATRALCAALRREDDATHGDNDETRGVFVVPIGARSLAHLLQGHRLPQNEADEYSIMQRTLSPAPCSPTRLPSPSKRAKPHRLPSMFTFPTRVADDDDRAASHACPVCSPQHDRVAWAVVARGSTRLQLAVRAIVALALHLPPTSPEGKTFVRDRGVDVLRLAAATSPQPVESRHRDGLVTEDAAPEVEATCDSYQMIRAIAQAGLCVFEPLEPATPSDPLASPTRRPSKRTDPTVPSLRSPLGDKLQAVSERSRRERLRRDHVERLARRAERRAEHRSRVVAAYDKAMATRTHLLHGLAVLSTGRPHPAAPDQRIVDWLDSFVTIDKREQQRREQHEQRQRLLLERQYEIDARRRRERDERAAMAGHDHDTPDTSAAERAAAQREAFAQLQRETRELHAQDEAVRARNDEAALAEQRERARQDALRVQLQAEERRRQLQETELLTREDHYYAFKILREKRARDEQARRAQRVDPVAEQQKRIDAMRRLDDERKQNQRELDAMRSEDLLARQRRFLEAEQLKMQADTERKARQLMETEERRSRVQWKLADEALVRQQQELDRQRRADARRAKREHEQQWKQWQAAWVVGYDAAGNLYYYNQLSGASQWENPLLGAPATGDAAATWPDTY